MPDSGYPMIVVSDGHIMRENLERCGKDLAWLNGRLAEEKIANADDIFLMTVNAAGQVYLARKEKA